MPWKAYPKKPRWRCKSCGIWNTGYRKTCKHCGKRRSSG